MKKISYLGIILIGTMTTGLIDHDIRICYHEYEEMHLLLFYCGRGLYLLK